MKFYTSRKPAVILVQKRKQGKLLPFREKHVAMLSQHNLQEQKTSLWPKISKSPPPPAGLLKAWPRTAGLDILLLVILTSLLFLHNIGHSSLWDSDEPKYGETAWEMISTQNWLVPHFNHTERFDKPPLFYWCIAASYLLSGYNEFATRFPSAIFGIGTVLMTYLLGCLLFSRNVGLWGGIILATSLQFIIQSRLAVVDTTLTFFITFAIYGVIGITLFPKAARYYICAALGMALAVLTKGPIGILFPLSIGIFGFTIFRTWKELQIKWIAIGTLLLAILALPWFVVVFGQYGNVYSENFFLFHNLKRFISPVDNQSGPWYYYFITLPVGFFPWSGFAIPLIGQLFTKSEQRLKLGLLGFWALFVFLFFTLAATKLPNYILPLFPAVSLLMAFLWTIPINLNPIGILTKYSFFCSLLLMGGIAFALPIVLQEKYPFLQTDVFMPLIPPTLLLLGAIIVSIVVLFKSSHSHKASLIMAVGFGFFILWTLHAIHPYVEAHKPVKRLAIAINAAIPLPEDTIITYRIASTSLVYYTRHKVIPVNDEEILYSFLKDFKKVFLVMPHKEYLNIKEKFPDYMQVIKEDSNLLLLIKQEKLSDRELNR